ncbi:DUF3396 domain-containing protein [Archangium gephyra]|uniref:type VI immunity family protein n=1 Tax=Archangium gephyra TaxID=48 RepID=UPI0035D42EB5
MNHRSFPTRDRPAFRPTLGALLASALLLACHAYAQSLDSASSACRTQPALCARVAGEETVIPQAAQRLAEFGASATAAAAVLNEAHSKELEQKLTECANMARETVLRQHMGGRSPTPAECSEKKNFGGKVRTRAMFLGEEMHKVALACAELGELGGASGLRSRLSSPGTTVQELEEERAVAGDTEQGQTLPAYRELARVLEPWLYHEPFPEPWPYHEQSNWEPDFPPEDLRRWERRFLD